MSAPDARQQPEELGRRVREPWFLALFRRPRPAASDAEAVTEALGRSPRSGWEPAWRAPDGFPSVIANPPLLDDGTPMPTRFWLVDPVLGRLVGRVEAAGGVRRAEAAVDARVLADAHDRYRAERDALVPDGNAGPVPSGGVGGTRQGVKCLHAHYAWWLAGGEDPVGAWVHGELEAATAEGPAETE